MSAEGSYLSAYFARLADGEPPAGPRPVPTPAPPTAAPAPVAIPPAPPRRVSANGEAGTASSPRPRETPPPAAPPPPPRPLAAGPQARNRAAVERTLARAGFSDGFVRELTDTALAHTLALAPRIGMVPAVRAALAQRIPPARPLPAAGCSIVVTGAGGSGKTTCCAALLGAYRAHSTLPARFATLVHPEHETALQLIMSPQMLEPQAADAPRVRRELRSASSDGVVVIDTPRLSPSEPGAIRELGRLLGELEPDRIVVALPVTLGAVAAEQLLASLEPIGPAALALTHADETDQLGVGIELACRFGLAPELMLEHASAGGWRLARLDPAELAARVLR
jgi:flagellar biosynthesis protein FlhF